LRRPLAALYWFAFVGPRRLVQIAQVGRYDVIVLYCGLLRAQSIPVLDVLLLLLARLLGVRTIYHLDDALFEVVEPKWYAIRCRLADVVATGNEAIAAFARSHGARVVRLEGWIDVESYSTAATRIVDAPKHCVIGWTGHFPRRRLAPLLNVVRRLHENHGVVLRVVGDEVLDESEWRGISVSELWEKRHETRVFSEFDIGIMPLEDTAYNRGKEAFKLKEYMAAGLPVVCSPVGHNVSVVENEKTGIFARTEQEWEDALTRLVLDPALRNMMGMAGRLRATEQYGRELYMSRLKQLVESLVEDRVSIPDSLAFR
jgi:glycosyltransferase involved in cell wall biosynthesis